MYAEKTLYLSTDCEVYSTLLLRNCCSFLYRQPITLIPMRKTRQSSIQWLKIGVKLGAQEFYVVWGLYH